MFEFSLYKSIFYELDPMKMEGVDEKKSGKSTYRGIKVHFDSVPEVNYICAEEKECPMLTRYFFYLNDEDLPTSLAEPDTCQVILEFYRKYFPSYLKEDVPEDLRGTDVSILNCLEPFKMPTYRPDQAFPNLIMYDDIKSGKVRPDNRKVTFPGLEFFADRGIGRPGTESFFAADSYLAVKGSGRTLAETYEGYTAFQGDQAGAQAKIDILKSQMASHMSMLNMDAGGAMDAILKARDEKLAKKKAAEAGTAEVSQAESAQEPTIDEPRTFQYGSTVVKIHETIITDGENTKSAAEIAKEAVAATVATEKAIEEAVAEAIEQVKTTETDTPAEETAAEE